MKHESSDPMLVGVASFALGSIGTPVLELTYCAKYPGKAAMGCNYEKICVAVGFHSLKNLASSTA